MEDQSSDSDLSDALTLARERLLISHALDSIAKLIGDVSRDCNHIIISLLYLYRAAIGINRLLTRQDHTRITRLQTVNGSSEPDEEWTGQIISERNASFELRVPSPASAYLSIHYICESAARLLFLSVHWARGLPAFQALP